MSNALKSIKSLFLLLCATSSLAVLPSHSEQGAPSAQSERANILLIITDDQSIDTINALGNNAINTPNIDRLAHSGMAFTHVFNQG